MTTKTEIASAVAGLTGLTKTDVGRVLDTAFDHMASTLAGGDRVHLGGFGIFSVKQSAARKGRNPATGEPIDIPARRSLKFKPAAELKARF